MKRKIIQIDEAKCNGCGACANACHEGAIGIVDGKAKLLRDDYCDGMGDCLPHCPMEGNSYASADELITAIEAKFGAGARFYTCSASDMDAALLVAFFVEKGKFKPSGSGFTMDREKVCKDY